MAVMTPVTRTLDEWFGTPLGQYLWRREEALLGALLGESFGHHGVEIGTPVQANDCLGRAVVAHRIRLYCSDQPNCFHGAFHGRLDSLSIQPRSLVAAVLVHVLEFHPAPGRVLAAMEQALVPGGVLVLAAFNPWSLWSVRRWVRPGAQPWSGRRIGARRYRDWLDALHLEPTRTAYLGQRPPCDEARWLERFAGLDRLGSWWPTAGAFVIAARKREYAGRRVARMEREQRQVLASSAPQATTRIAQDGFP